MSSMPAIGNASIWRAGGRQPSAFSKACALNATQVPSSTSHASINMKSSEDATGSNSPPRPAAQTRVLALQPPFPPFAFPQDECSLLFPPSPTSPLHSQSGNSSSSWVSSVASPTPSVKSSSAIPSNRANKWVRKEKIGQGAQGSIYRCKEPATGREVAVKVIWTRELSAAAVEGVKREVKTMKRLRHPHLVRYLQATEKKQSELRIYMEYAAGGSLSARLARAGALSLPLVKRYTRQLCEALQHLHRHGIAHRDIKCANIFLTASDLDTCSNALADVKLGDFGTFKEVGCASLVGGLKGTPHWMAPEVIRQQHLDGENSEGWFRADVWSLGCAILEMITGHSPWQQYSNPLTAMYQIVCSDVTPTIPADASEETASFLKLCLQRNPAHRATVAQLLEHAFVRVATDIMSKTTTNPSKRYTKRKSPDASKHTVVGSNQQAILSLPPKITTRNDLARSPEDSVMQPRAPTDGREGLNEELKPRAPGLEGRRRGEKNQASTPRHVCEIRSGLTDMEPSGKPKSTRAARLKPLEMPKTPEVSVSTNQVTHNPSAPSSIIVVPRAPLGFTRGVSAGSSRLPRLLNLKTASARDGISISPVRLRRIATAPTPPTIADDGEDVFPDKFRLPPLSARPPGYNSMAADKTIDA